jgi:phosphatidylserine decarboxylase
VPSLAAHLQHLLPQRLLSRLAGRIAAARSPWLKDRLIRMAIRRFAIDLAEAELEDPAAYPSFDAFFTRALKPGARRPDEDPEAVLAPADGRIVSAGSIEQGLLVQAKGHRYRLDELLADPAAAKRFEGGQQLTIYLAPRDYHRVHMPAAGILRRALYLPGRLFSVNRASTDAIPGLFARNERLACVFEGETGLFAVVMVAALLVGGIETVFAGRIVPPHPRRILDLTPARPLALARFAELGRFHYGSTVILLLAPGAQLLPAATVDAGIRVGTAIARRPPATVSCSA